MRPKRNSLRLIVLTVDFEVQGDFFTAVERGNRAHSRFLAIEFRVDFVLHIGIETGKPVTSLIIREMAEHGVGAQILQKNHAILDGFVRLVGDRATNSAELDLLLRALREGQPGQNQ